MMTLPCAHQAACTWGKCDCGLFPEPPERFPMSAYPTRKPECHPLSASGRRVYRRVRWGRVLGITLMCASTFFVACVFWYLAMAPVLDAAGQEIEIMRGGR